jgi:hypothetical protein
MGQGNVNGKMERTNNDPKRSTHIRLDKAVLAILGDWANQLNAQQTRILSSRLTERRVDELIVRWLKKREKEGKFKPEDILEAE